MVVAVLVHGHDVSDCGCVRPATKVNGVEKARTESGSRHVFPLYLVIVLAVIGVVAAAATTVILVEHRGQQNPTASFRPSGIPANVSTSLAVLMALSPVPARAAPGFSLVDQRGRVESLASFRGHAVVLEFMDPHCTDICPIVSQEFLDAYRDLGSAASHVDFVAVNVNQYYASVASMKSFTLAHGLDAIPSWHFLTGNAAQLKSVWRAFGVQVEAPNPAADIIHTSVVYFIDPRGRERFIGTPTDQHTAKGVAYLPSGPLTAWGRGLAYVARDTLS